MAGTYEERYAARQANFPIKMDAGTLSGSGYRGARAASRASLRWNSRLCGQGPGSAGRDDVGLREIVTLEQQPGSVGLGTGISKTIAHVEGGWVPPLAELGIGLGRSSSSRSPMLTKLQIVQLDEALHHGSGRRDRKHVGPAQPGDRLPHRDCRTQAQPVPRQADRRAIARRSRPPSSQSSPRRRRRSSRFARQIIEERFVGYLPCRRRHRVLLPPCRDALAERDGLA